MQTAREYLVEKGLAKAGRGKFSFVAKAQLEKALSSGIKFSDWPKETTAPKPVKNKDVKPAKVEETGIAELAPYRYPEDIYVAKETITGVKRSLREACRTCRVSLVGHVCNSPQIVSLDGTSSVAVRIVAA